MIQVDFQACLHQTGLETKALEREMKPFAVMLTDLQERSGYIDLDQYLDDLDNISRSENFWVKLDLCFFGCQSHRGPEDPFGCGELGLDVVDT